MQTFLPYQNFLDCAAALDNKRLNKQITECKQIAMAILGESDGWRNHPAVAMWRDSMVQLWDYSMAMYNEWRRRYDEGERGGKYEHKAGEWIKRNFSAYVTGELPSWLTPAVCSAYRALLLAKDPQWYGQFGWSEEPNGDSKRIFEMIKASL